jgi:hypothetical protein
MRFHCFYEMYLFCMHSCRHRFRESCIRNRLYVY